MPTRKFLIYPEDPNNITSQTVEYKHTAKDRQQLAQCPNQVTHKVTNNASQSVIWRASLTVQAATLR